jgi:hypothetical protein
MAKRTTSDVIEKLSPEEAKDVLLRLLDVRPDLRPEVQQIVGEILAKISFEEVAAGVEAALRSITMDQMRDRAGRHAGGYTEPTEAALRLMEEAVQPFLDDMLRRRALGRDAEAQEICQGMVLGLYRMRGKMQSHDVLQWCPDFPSEHARWTVRLWSGDADEAQDKRRRPAPHRTLPREFVEKHVAEWAERPWLKRDST